MNTDARHAIVAIYLSGRSSDRAYSIWQVTDFGKPISVLNIESTWTECTPDQFEKGWPMPKPAEFSRQADAAKAGKEAARQADLAFDKNYRSFWHLSGPPRTCAVCERKLGKFGWDSVLCKDCQVVHEHGRLAQGEKSAYMVGLHPGNNLSPYPEPLEEKYPLPTLLASLVGSKLRTPSSRFGKDEGKVLQAVGYRDPRYWHGGDMIVDLTETQAVAWSKLVEWIYSKLTQTEKAALDQGTRLLTRLATGELSPEDFEPKVVRLRQGKSDG